MYKKLLLLLTLSTVALIHSHAQSISPSTLNTSGGFTTLLGNTYEWSIGEMVLVKTATAGSITVTQGLLQPNKTSGGNAINESQFIFDHVVVYPNPTENLFYLQADFKTVGELVCLVYDMNGKTLTETKINLKGEAIKIPFNISSFAVGNYMLMVAFTSAYPKNTINKAAYKIEKTN